jgi:hypothetical protein
LISPTASNAIESPTLQTPSSPHPTDKDCGVIVLDSHADETGPNVILYLELSAASDLFQRSKIVENRQTNLMGFIKDSIIDYYFRIFFIMFLFGSWISIFNKHVKRADAKIYSVLKYYSVAH